MTDTTFVLRKPSRVAELIHRLRAWLNEPVFAEDRTPTFSPRDWADLPVHHPIREDKDGR
jgi:hypothetical protein